MYVLFTEVTVEPVEAVEDTNGSQKYLWGYLPRVSVGAVDGGRGDDEAGRRGCRLHARRGSVGCKCRVGCLRASGEHTYMLGCVRVRQRAQAMQCFE